MGRGCRVVASALAVVIALSGCRQPTAASQAANIPLSPAFARDTGLTSHRIDYQRFEARAATFIATTRCGLSRGIYTCRSPATSSGTTRCEFVWPMTRLSEGGKTSVITGRNSVVQSQFRNGGVAEVRGEPAGVAVVSCGGDRAIRVTFILSDARATRDHGSLMRTVGFDWVDEREQGIHELYELETFALASLFHISQSVASGARAVKGTDGRVVFSQATAKAAARVRKTYGMVRVGNNSGNELARSRKACRLGLEAAGITSAHVAPSEIIESYYGSQAMVVLASASGAGPRSAPCPLVLAWLAGRGAGPARFPTSHTSATIDVFPGGDTPQAPLQNAVATRAAAVTLYLLGFEVAEPSGSENKGARGYWPRKNLISSPPNGPVP